jgi:hypothetical protein|tara:strand:+ start:1605 stop:1820 length:216 start_codon:yes stop_codon:yes gene_type:complete
MKKIVERIDDISDSLRGVRIRDEDELNEIVKALERLNVQLFRAKDIKPKVAKSQLLYIDAPCALLMDKFKG